MEVNVVANRYSKAFLTYLDSCSKPDKVLEQVKRLLAILNEIPEFHIAIQDFKENYTPEYKLELISKALDNKIEVEFETFLKLLINKGRIHEIKLILLMFIDLYNKKNKLKEVKYIVAIDSPEFDEKLIKYIEEKTRCNVILKKTIKPEIIAGFIIQVDDIVIDASVIHRINTLKKELAD